MKFNSLIYQNFQSALNSKAFTAREVKVIEYLQINQGSYRKDVESRFADVHYLPSLLQKLNLKLERLCGQRVVSKRIADGRARYYLTSGQNLDEC